MNKRNYKIECVGCRRVFAALRPTDKFCSSPCRHSYKFQTLTPERKLARKQRLRKWNDENKARRRDYMLRYTYGISSEKYEELLTAQNHCCAICKRHEKNFKRRMAVEHNHKTREIQGIVCDHCNRSLLGRLRDPALFRAAADYLENSHTGLFVPEPTRKRRRKKKK